MYPGKFYFEDSSFKLIDNDTFKTLKQFEEKTFDMIFELKFSLMDSAGNEIELIPGGSQV